MLRGNSYYKSSDLLDNSFKGRMNSFFNPYGYNFESNQKDLENKEKEAFKSKSHNERSKMKK